MASLIKPHGQAKEIFFDDLIVSKTDLAGRITYANDVFCKVAGYSEMELLGKHPRKVAKPGFHGSGAMICGRRVFGD
jgi:PAS domain S-box-containing protein